ncbi:MAG TPA: fumarylacetoacetate hydrolase family protein [Pseudonocardiaceae bacterium]|jgi:2-keto-4-pentenoate hydratase/2-oxohepta-3-ene-1,7-dioic acid hydratase in catechol pathway|nr:fumarylacetoacetate hydrolase family protein [Pseudonocardiaceae bacterium]
MRLANRAGRLALLTDRGAVDVRRAGDGRFDSDPESVFGVWDELADWAATVDPAEAEPYDPAELRCPVPRPRQVFAIALNYRPHAAEAGWQEPAEPLVFTKFSSCLTGPGGAIELPPGKVDWELEMVAVIGRPAYRVPEADGWNPVVALTIGQDLSERESQLAGQPPQFSLGKSFPGFGPVGPALVSLDEIDDRDDLELTCEVSGERMQHDRTANLIFGVPRLVSFLSATCPLLPGDLIFTGTPAGVGNRRTPQRFLTESDELVSRIGGLGEMRHRFTARAAQEAQV